MFKDGVMVAVLLMFVIMFILTVQDWSQAIDCNKYGVTYFNGEAFECTKMEKQHDGRS